MSGRLTRRQMIGGLAVAGPLTALGLAGCGGGGDDTAAGAATTASNQSHGGSAVAVVDAGPVVAPRDPHTTFRRPHRRARPPAFTRSSSRWTSICWRSLPIAR